MKKEHNSNDMTNFQHELLSSNKSSFALYKEMFLGSDSFSYLMKYEFVNMLTNGMPGALGLLLRKLFYPQLFKKTGRNVVFGKNMTLRHPIKITVGDHVAIDDNVVMDAKGCQHDKEFSLGNNIIIGHTSTLCSKGGSMIIGNNCNFGSHVALYCASDIRFGKNILLGPGSFIGGGTYKFDSVDQPIISQGYELKGPISIGDNCWFGASVTVVDGVSIGENSIIGAGAVVLDNIPPFSIAAGVPAKVLKKRKSE